MIQQLIPDAEHDVLVGNEAVATVFSAFPPVARHLSVQCHDVGLFEAELALRTRREIKLCDPFQRLRFCNAQYNYRKLSYRILSFSFEQFLFLIGLIVAIINPFFFTIFSIFDVF